MRSPKPGEPYSCAIGLSLARLLATSMVLALALFPACKGRRMTALIVLVGFSVNAEAAEGCPTAAEEISQRGYEPYLR